jgi:hypothetical protein
MAEPDWMIACPYCDGLVDEGLVCCDRCWRRIPTHLGENRPLRYWRSNLRVARQIRSWNEVGTILDAVKAWLAKHPRYRLTPTQGADHV